MTESTKTLKIKVKKILVTDLCEEYLIPYIKCRQTVIKDKKTGENKKVFAKGTVPEKFADWDYAKCEEWNKNIKFQPTHVNILLAKAEQPDKFCVIDFDDKEDLEPYLDLFGNDWVSKSSQRQLPHLWRLRKENDYSKCTTKIPINGVKTGIDIKYYNIIERIDSKIEYSNGDFPPPFEFEEFHPKPISEKPQPKVVGEASAQYNIMKNNYVGSRFIKHLQNIDHTQYTNNYTDWLKIGFAIKRVFYNDEQPNLWFEILIAYSRLSQEHQSEDTDDWENAFEQDSKCGIPTILEYSHKSNEEKFNIIENEYYKLKRADVTDERSILLNTGYKMLMDSVKEHDVIQEKTLEEFPPYEIIKEEFEKTHCKIVNKAIFIIQTETDTVMMTENKFTSAYKHVNYYTPKFDKSGNYISNEAKCFIKRWFFDEDIMKYDDMGIYPPPLKCPKNIYNLWSAFQISTYTDAYEKDEEGLKMFLNHIKILCGNEELVADYIIKWFAQMFKFPATKTIIPTFISEEGAGKGSILELMGRMMGPSKTLVTTSPSRDVWGNHNSLMGDCFLVNLNEMSIKETTDSEGKIKGLITDPQLTINPKGVGAYVTNSFHRFIITTQNENPVKTRKDDRRNLIIRSSDEKCSDKQYFIKLREKLEDLNVMRTIYDYFMSIDGLDKFVSIPIPKTEWQNDMKEMSRSTYDLWLEYLVRHNQDQTELAYYSEEQCQLFCEWCNLCKIKYETNHIKMGLAIKRLNIPGISKKHCKLGNQSVYDIAVLKAHYKIGFLIDIENL